MPAALAGPTPAAPTDTDPSVHPRRWAAATCDHRWTVLPVTHDVREGVALADEVVTPAGPGTVDPVGVG